MTDKQFQKILDDTSQACRKYLLLLDKSEKEYVRRFGFHPSDVDDDFWIDTYQYEGSNATVKEVTESAKMRG